ncbi:twin-arginine translocase TatA/TatE family subunit [Nesterenkonia sp. NBAIMH1]|uniref:twin-arginine translocase TatA/TatE family subunit n=1 Tax=Nesterenkonia sp. NBAIMH1 TaxID=2600320 RepID=UPI0011B74380|nr:twin-arginine translocase TatA/TatE family subunit [Nesterenkonia sp. NBAIMH1]
MPGINAYEFLVLLLLAVILLGPERLPQYAQKLGQWVRQGRRMAEDAKVRFREETGTDFDEVDWDKYDPRQYDPRRIIREALAEEADELRGTGEELRRAADPRALFSSGPKKAGGAMAAGVAGAAASGTGAHAGAASLSPSGDSGSDPAGQLPAPFDIDAT